MTRTRKLILLAVLIAIVLLAWALLPSPSTAAQGRSGVVPSLVAGPFLIRGGDATATLVAEPAVLHVTNVSDQPVSVLMTIRDAASFFTVLASDQRTLEPGEGAVLRYSDRQHQQRSVIGVITPELQAGVLPNNDWMTGFRSILATLSVVDPETRSTKLVAGTSVVPITISPIRDAGVRR